MKQITFNQLPLPEKAVIVAEFATFIDAIVFYDYNVHLFSLNSHFVEVYYNRLTRQVERISIASYEDIDKYLSLILLKLTWL